MFIVTEYAALSMSYKPFFVLMGYPITVDAMSMQLVWDFSFCALRGHRIKFLKDGFYLSKQYRP